MSEKLPYEQHLQQQWTDIPLPDENLAWDDMARRLEEDDDKPVVFWWRPGCGLLGVVLLVILGLGWWFLRPEKQFINKGHDTGKQATTTTDQHKSGGNKQGVQPPEKKSSSPEEISHKKEDSTYELVPPPSAGQPPVDAIERPKKTKDQKETDKQATPATHQEESKSSLGEKITPKNNARKEKDHGPQFERGARRVPASTTRKPGSATRESGSSKKAPGSTPQGPGITAIVPGSSSKVPGSPSKGGKKKGRGEASGTSSNVIPGSLDTTGTDTTGQDTATTKTSDTTNRVDTVAIPPVKKDTVKKSRPPAVQPAAPPVDSSDKKKLWFSAGLSLAQQLPLAGQKPTPYSSTGRKGSLADYIPSVYMRLHKEDKWFVQAEFKYGAPQYSKEFTYQQASIPDTGSNPRYVTNSSARLKKTFYHQLPITFHHYVLPNWSVGGGVIWNKFYAALSDQETIKHDNITQTDEVVFKGLVSIKEDTSGTFASSYFQAVVESQYKWKRFSFGARYAFGLQPYIRFTLPGLGTREEKNSSLQLFLRFDLYKPKRD